MQRQNPLQRKIEAMAKKQKKIEDSFVFFDVIYEDGTKSSRRKINAAGVAPLCLSDAEIVQKLRKGLPDVLVDGKNDSKAVEGDFVTEPLGLVLEEFSIPQPCVSSRVGSRICNLNCPGG